jgi:hypothetical protein
MLWYSVIYISGIAIMVIFAIIRVKIKIPLLGTLLLNVD